MSVRRREPYYLEEVGHQPPLSLARKSTSDGLTGTKRQTRLHASSRTVQPALRRLDNFRRQIPAQSLISDLLVWYREQRRTWLGRITVSPEKKKSIFVGFRQAQCLLPRWRDMCGPDITRRQRATLPERINSGLVSTNLLEQRTVVQLLVTALSRQRRAETDAERPSVWPGRPSCPPVTLRGLDSAPALASHQGGTLLIISLVLCDS
ncbi:hypothetical protein HPB48_019114 [Haemaphysalis longicornis]|uniref:Uncharacterized protein n=1 Tax=Haemaphysalis longicornis TaxID=44386 RepID=A0A9J6GBN4_HAELO|nr:hypothetical protein HPB48_019114 [Haemaphysalis longicornis]